MRVCQSMLRVLMWNTARHDTVSGNKKGLLFGGKSEAGGITLITPQNWSKLEMTGCCYRSGRVYRCPRPVRRWRIQIGTGRKVVNDSSHGSSMSVTHQCVSSLLVLKLSIHQGSVMEKINGVRVTLKVALMRNLWEMLIFYLQNRTKQFSPKPS